MRKRFLTILTISLIFTDSGFGFLSFGGLNSATETTQIANNIQLALQYSKQLNQYALQAKEYQTQLHQYSNQLKSYEKMLKNIGTLPQEQWNNFLKINIGLKNILTNSGAMSFWASNIDKQFKSTYSEYDSFLQRAKNKNLNFENQYTLLSQERLRGVNAQLKYLNLTAQEMQNDESVMRKLQSFSGSSVGQLSAIQATNEIALHQTHTLKKLHQTMMTQASVQSQYIASVQTKEDLNRVAKKEWSGRKANINKNDDKPLGGKVLR
jgi:P-type conjugative transfer protein TrbJ